MATEQMHTCTVEEMAEFVAKHHPPEMKEIIGRCQLVVFVMAGGGLTGRAACEKPAEFHIDDNTQTPYDVDALRVATQNLARMAQAAGMNPWAMPKMPFAHNLGVF